MVALFAQQSNITPFPTQQKSNEWFTPSRYIEAARLVMGSIDLDPASCFEANQTVRAKHYYAVRDNGLVQPWHGNVWLNPPFGRVNNKSVLGMFVARLLEAFYRGDVKQAILLSTARTDNKQLNRLWDFSICFPDHHVNFYCPDGERSSVTHMHGAAFVYLGSNNQAFTDIFSEFGAVIPANVAIRRQKVTPLSLWEVQP